MMGGLFCSCCCVFCIWWLKFLMMFCMLDLWLSRLS